MGFKLAAFADEASGRLDEQVRAMKENGVGMLEIRGVDGKNVAELTVEEAGEVRRRLDDAGIKVWSIGSPYGKILMKDDFGAHLESFKRTLEVADVLGAQHFRMFSFYGTKEVSDDAGVIFDAVAARIQRFVDAAEGSDVMLCHENEKGIYGDMAANCRQLHEAFPSIRAIFDPANFVQCSQDTLEAWDMLEPYVEYMHIKDADEDGFVVPAGCGIGHVPEIIQKYKGRVLTVEPHLTVFPGFDRLERSEQMKLKFRYPDSFTAFAAAVDAVKNIIGEGE